MNRIDRYKIEEEQDWRGWIEKIPAIEFDAGWKVQVIPPFSGALARFRVTVGDKTASVYLDGYEAIGFFGEPYWEVYPVGDDVGRCAMAATDELLSLIRQSIAT